MNVNVTTVLGAKTIDENLALMEKGLQAGTDGFEARIDSIDGQYYHTGRWREIYDRANEMGKYTVTTIMPSYELKASPIFNDSLRLKIFREHIRFKPTYITIEKQALEPYLKDESANSYKDEFRELMFEAKHNHKVKVIVANHDFDKTPQSLDTMLHSAERIEELGADMIKLAYKALDFSDVHKTLSVLKEDFGIPITAITMGEVGQVGRLLALINGSAMMYGSVDTPPPNTGMIETRIIKKLLSDEQFVEELSALYDNPNLAPAENLKNATELMKAKINNLN